MSSTQGTPLLVLQWLDDFRVSDTCLDFSPELQSYPFNCIWTVKLKIPKVELRILLCKMYFSFWVPSSVIPPSACSLAGNVASSVSPRCHVCSLESAPCIFLESVIFSLYRYPYHFNSGYNSHCLGFSSMSQLMSQHLVQFFSISYSPGSFKIPGLSCLSLD